MNYPDTDLVPEDATFICATEDMDLYYTGRDSEYLFVLPPEYGEIAFIHLGVDKSKYPETSHKMYDICLLHHNIMF